MIGLRTGALLASLVLASSALADPKAPSEKDKQTAGELVKKAIAKSQAGDHAAAIELYLRAYKIVPNSILLSNVGSEFKQNGEPSEALRYFCMYLEKDPGGSNVPYATSQAKALQIELGNKNVDDRDVCAPPKPEPRRDPKRTEPLPEPEPRKPPTSKPGQPDPEPAQARAAARDPKLLYASMGTGLAGLVAVGIGAYAGIRASAISDQISTHDRNTPWPTNIQDIERRGQLYENIQIGSLIAGGALVTTGAILYVVSRSSSPVEASTDKALTLAPTTNGFVVAGRF